jgi:polysaccharide biosynthesis protein PslG
VHSLWFDSTDADMDRELDLVKRANGNVIRLDVGWSTLESGGKGVYSPWYLGKLDRVMRAAQARGIKVIVSLVSTPCWASSAPESLRQGCEGSWWDRGVAQHPPTNAADYGDAARFITARYGEALAALEVWNEPNIDRFLAGPRKAAEYAALVRAAYPAAKAGNPHVPVLAGALAAADRPFLDELYAHGIKGHYDAISVHPYNEWRDPADRWHERWRQYTFLPGIEWVREGQRVAGDSSPLWITEFGWSTCREHSWCVDRAQQADYTVRAFQLLGGLDYVEAASLYQLRDNGTNPTDLESNWGLVDRDYDAKPAFAAVSAALAGRAGAKPRALRSPGRARRRPARRGRPFTLRVRIGRRGLAYATGRAPAGRRITLRFRRCRPAQARRRVVVARAGRHGAYRRRLGRARRLNGCRVVARLSGPAARVSASRRSARLRGRAPGAHRRAARR